MPRVLLGGFDAVLKDSLKRRLNDYPISRVSSVPEIQEELAGGSVSLLILDSDLDGAVAAASPPPNHLINKDRRPETAATTAALEALEELRANPQWAELPVIYYASTESSGEAARRLAADLRIREILLPPLDQNELARQTAQALGILLAPSAGETKMQHAVAAARSRFLETVAERLETLDGAGAALLEGNLKPGVRELARREAHKLAGLLGTIGFAAGSRFAREMEGILAGAVSSGHAQAMRYSELAVALRLDVEKPSISAAPLTERAGDESQTSILIVDSDDEFSERLEAEALGHSVRVRRARDFARAASMIAEDIPDVALASLFLSGKEEEGLEFIESLAAHAPPVPVIVLTSKDTFTDRVEVARRGGHGFLSRSSPASKILEAGLKLVDRLHSADVRIMAVDDDPHILSLLCSLLETRGALIKTLADPAQFWDSLEAFVPDLLVLDVDMPGLSGLDLCRVVRNDSRWAQTPIIFLTGHNNPGAIQRVFAAGADDFVSKPIVGPELLTRIFNRLERVRMQRRISETDLLTGAFNRRKSSQMMADFIELSRKHEQPFSLAALEIEDLKRINAGHGQAAGDIALERTARLLQNAFRSEDVFARWGGGEFVVGMYGLTRYDGVQRLTGLLDRIHKETFKSKSGAEFQVRLSAGVAQFPEDGMNLEELYESAAIARACSQSAGGCRAAAAGPASGRQGARQKTDVALVMRDEAQASLLLHTLESRGYRSRWIQDGRAAEKLLAGPEPALQSKVILMEVDLTNVDGISLLKQFGSDGVLQKTRVIMLTTPSVANEAQAVLQLGAFDSVAKPLNPPVVAQHIRRALDAY